MHNCPFVCRIFDKDKEDIKTTTKTNKQQQQQQQIAILVFYSPKRWGSAVLFTIQA